MYRIDTATAELNEFGSGKSGYTNGTPGTVPATQCDATHFNAFQEELAGIVEQGGGLALVKANNNQVLMALRLMQSAMAAANWAPKTSGVSSQLNGGCFLAYQWPLWGIFIVGAGGVILTSSDGGDTWSAMTSGTSNALNAVASDPSLSANVVLVAVGASGTIVYSTNASGWNTGTSGIATALNAVAFGVATGSDLTNWVAVGASGVALTSPDGTTWTSHAAFASAAMSGVAVNPSGNWVAVGAGGAVFTSSTPATTASWVSRTSGTSQALKAVTWNAALGQFVAVAADGHVLVSTDGVGTSWALVSTVASAGLNAVAVDANGAMVACGNVVSSDSAALVTSAGGATWLARQSPLGNEALFGCIAGFSGGTGSGGLFVVFGAGGVVARSLRT